MMADVIVVNLRSLAYSGTSWINLVLGSHPDGFAIGPPQRVWKLSKAKARTACRVHGRRCPFWPGFLRSYDPEGNFLLQLAEYSGRKFIVLNNPTGEFRKQVLTHPSIDLRTVRIVRDGRANIVSMMRHLPGRYVSVLDAVQGWLQPALTRIAQLPSEQVTLSIRYEELILEPGKELARIGAVLGVEYAENAIRFWEYEHHLANGNTGVIDLLRRLQGLKGSEHRRSDYYQELYHRTMQYPDVPVMDESWQSKN